MKVVLQRVTSASVSVKDEEIASIGLGYMLLVGVEQGDTAESAIYLANKINKLRIFEDDDEKMNLDIHQVKGSILSVSQFTLLADTKKGTRPSFTRAGDPKEAEKLYHFFNEELQKAGLEVFEGEFGAHMVLDIKNDGPCTIILEK